MIYLDTQAPAPESGASLGSGLGDVFLTPAIRQSLKDPETLRLLEVQIAGILKSETVQLAVRPLVVKAATWAFVGVLAGSVLANLITDRMKK